MDDPGRHPVRRRIDPALPSPGTTGERSETGRQKRENQGRDGELRSQLRQNTGSLPAWESHLVLVFAVRSSPDVVSTPDDCQHPGA